MFKNYLIITLRKLYKEKLYALINIFGLALGISCCIVLSLYINNELSFDKHHEKADRIYRIVNEYTFSGVPSPFATSSLGVGPLLKLDNPDLVESYTRFNRRGAESQVVFRHEEDTYLWDDAYTVDENVFDVFDHRLVYGDFENALATRLSIAVSLSFARTYFGDQNPVGEVLTTDIDPYTITAVFADLPDNSHMKYDVLFSRLLIEPSPPSAAELQRRLGNPGDFTYLLMAERAEDSDINRMLDNLSDVRLAAMVKEFGADFTAEFRAQKLTDVHLDSYWDRDLPTANILYIYGFIAVALFILIVASINYINLATARSMQRAREVGMRKVLGAQRRQLIWQFLLESFFFVIVALFIALAVVYVLLDFRVLDQVLGASLNSAILFEPLVFLSIVLLSLLLGLVSGLYPAFYLSSVAPSVALSSSAKGSKTRSGRLRQLLVLTQFTISIGVIASTLLMSSQMRFISDLSLGFDKENKLIVPLRGADVVESANAIRNELLTNPGILGATMAAQIPGDQVGSIALYLQDASGVTGMHVMSTMSVSDDFLETLNITLLEGRRFGQKLLTDVDLSALVNETLVEKMGWEQPIGKTIENGSGGVVARIIGVMEDFHFESLYKPVAPLMMLSPTLNLEGATPGQRANLVRQLVINIAGTDVASTLEVIRDTMLKFDATHPFEFEFLDNHLDQLYQSEQSVMSLITIFSVVCVLISCLGLFGLSSFTTTQRTKEIGIRKVIGATGPQIIMLLSRDILLLVGFAALLASGISFFTMSQWLNSFAYRETISPLIFLASAALALVVALITITLQSSRTVKANPVIALRYE